MPVNDLFRDFLQRFSFADTDPQELAMAYLPLAKQMLYADEELVRRVVDLLHSNIYRWARQYSEVYKHHRGVISKADLENKTAWYVPRTFHEVSRMQTAGTTTGYPFAYLRWNRSFWQIEANNHYDLILDEFNVGPKPLILYCLLNHVWNNDFIFVNQTPTDLIERHGITRQPVVHVVQNTGLFEQNRTAFYDAVIDHLQKFEFDIVTVVSHHLHSLIHHLRRRKFKGKIGKLLSHTGNMMLDSDRHFLEKEGWFDHICDHMRCWDGGAGFFECEHGTYHLMDNLAYAYEGENGQLISTDYFSFPSPFVDYWNGDQCNISKEYKRCKCGRLHRPFKILESRPFSVKGKNMGVLRDEIARVCKWVCQIRCEESSIEVMSRRALEEIDQSIIRKILTGFKVVFTVEEFSTQHEGELLTRFHPLLLGSGKSGVSGSGKSGSIGSGASGKPGSASGGSGHHSGGLLGPIPDPSNWAASENNPENLIVECNLGLGDMALTTAVVRSLHTLYPGHYNVEVKGYHEELFWHSADTMQVGEGKVVKINYPGYDLNVNYVTALCHDLGQQLGKPLYCTTMQPHITLSSEEAAMKPHPGPYMCLNAGASYFMTKRYPSAFYQEIVDWLIDRGIAVIQLGDREVNSSGHPFLKGVINRVDTTTARELCVLAAHAIGSFGSVTGLLHLAAAFAKPYWAISAGRETPNYFSWPTTRILHTIGYLPCCATAGCYKIDVNVNDTTHENNCLLPVLRQDGELVPKCMELISPKTVIESIKGYLESQGL